MKIEIFSDIICPWCFIGKQRLDQVLRGDVDGADKGAGEIGADIELRWRPYLLYPNIPLEGVDRAEMLARRYGDNADPARVPERIRQEAEAEGLELRFDLIKRTPNTLMAHRLMEHAFAEDPSGLKQHELAERLFRAYFCEGVDVGDQSALSQQAERVGLGYQTAYEFLGGGEAVGEVEEQLNRAPEIGVSGVPGYYLAEGFLLPGAQTAETMAQIISRVKARLTS